MVRDRDRADHRSGDGRGRIVTWDNLIAHPRLTRDLYHVSRQMRYTAPELLTGYIAWLQHNLREYELTTDECLHLIYSFAARVDREKGGAS